MRVGVTGSDGKPIAGSKIHAAIWTKQKPFKSNRDYLADAQGLCVVELPQTVNIRRLWASAEGRVTLFAHWESGELQGKVSRLPGDFTFKLPPGTVIGGTVKNEDDILKGKPDDSKTPDVFEEFQRLLSK